MSDLLKDRERGEEAAYVRRLEERLIEKVRQRARLDEIAQALADMLRVDDRALLRRAGELGLDQQTGAAILLAPLVEVAWADGSADDAEKKVVLDVAEGRGLVSGTPAHAKLLEWLRERPSDALFEVAVEVMRAGYEVLPPHERDKSIGTVLDACRSVAEASGGGLARVLGPSHAVSAEERATIDSIAARLRAPRERSA